MPPKRVLRFRLLQGDGLPDLSDVHDFLRAKLNVAQVEVCDDLAHPFMDDTIDRAQEYVLDLGSSEADSQVFRKFARGTGTMPLSSLAGAASSHAAAGANTKDQGAATRNRRSRRRQQQMQQQHTRTTIYATPPHHWLQSRGAASSWPPPPATAAAAGAAAGDAQPVAEVLAGASTPAVMHCDVFISHAGEQKYGLVTHVELRLREHHPELSVFVDYTMWGGDGAWDEIQERLRGAKAVVVVLSRAFVRKPFPMAELALALEGAAHGQVLVPVLAPCLSFEAAEALELAPEMSAQDVAKEQEGLLRCLVPVAAERRGGQCCGRGWRGCGRCWWWTMRGCRTSWGAVCHAIASSFAQVALAG